MKKFTAIAAILYIAIALLAAYGYVVNLIGVFKCDFESPYRCEVVRVVGVPLPFVGAIAGYIDLRQ